MFTNLQIHKTLRQSHGQQINIHGSCIFFFPLSILWTCSSKPGGWLAAVRWPFCMSKSCRAALNVMPPTLGGPQEHNGPPPGIGSGLARLLVRSTTSFCLLAGSLPLLTCSFSLPYALVLVANPWVVFFLFPKMVDGYKLGIQLDHYIFFPLLTSWIWRITHIFFVGMRWCCSDWLGGNSCISYRMCCKSCYSHKRWHMLWCNLSTWPKCSLCCKMESRPWHIRWCHLWGWPKCRL